MLENILSETQETTFQDTTPVELPPLIINGDFSFIDDADAFAEQLKKSINQYFDSPKEGPYLVELQIDIDEDKISFTSTFDRDFNKKYLAMAYYLVGIQVYRNHKLEQGIDIEPLY